MRSRLNDFPSITFLKNHDVKNISICDTHVLVKSFDKANNRIKFDRSSYLAACDGAKGVSKSILNNPFRNLSPKTKILNINFLAKDLALKKTVPDAIFYWILNKEKTSFIGPVDLKKGLWFSQIIYDEHAHDIEKPALSKIINKITGIKCDVEITDFHFWDMQVQLADFFSIHNRVFWLGDSAHAFAPTGGLGLNTGFGDAMNLGWKLSAVIKNKANPSLLSTYEQERRPVCLNNLEFAKQSAKEVLMIKEKYPPEKDYKSFAFANAVLGKKFLKSSGLTMGYAYHDSPLTLTHSAQAIQKINPTKYTPIAEPGYFLPHSIYNGKSIYEALSPIHWNLLINDVNKYINIDKYINILEKCPDIYPGKFLLVRPDWHISITSNEWSDISTFIHTHILPTISNSS